MLCAAFMSVCVAQASAERGRFLRRIVDIRVFVFLPQRLPTTSAFYSTSGLRCSEFALLLDALVGDVHTPVIDVLQSSSVV